MFKMYHYLRKLKALGLRRSCMTLSHRIQTKVNNQSHIPAQPTEWEFLALWDSITKDRYLSFLFLRPHDIDQYSLVAKADRYVDNFFEVLGSGMQQLSNIPWHADIRLQKQNPKADFMFDAHTYYKDITIIPGGDAHLVKDIKVPWELARFQYAPILGLAYHTTKNSAYASAAQQQIVSWLDANSFCYGIHWFNGMEVAIRAVNWIIAWHWLHNYFKLDDPFYKRFLCSLYDHMRYLECNWEWYDGRTNNHYLTNLVGYAYLCWFFKDMSGIQKKWHWCYSQLIQELDWQIFEEGTCYEGSTKYHGFVTELFVHGFLVMQHMGMPLSDKIREKIYKMLQFVELCKPMNRADPISIGDDDSGSLLDKHILNVQIFSQCMGIPYNQVMAYLPEGHYFSDFGISLSGQHYWHVTLRHYAYSPRQPTGHFHQDAGSVTVAYKGIPIIVDPGTYVYSASSYWRHYFRSAAAHNTIYEKSECQQADLFGLSLNSLLSRRDDRFMKTCIHVSHGIITRTIHIESDALSLCDSINLDSGTVTWNITFSPDVILVKHENTWLIYTDHQLHFKIISSVSLSIQERWYSPSYGTIMKTYGLTIQIDKSCKSMETILYKA